MAGAALTLGLTMGMDGPELTPTPMYGIEPVVEPIIANPARPEPVQVRSGIDLLEDAVSRIRGGDLQGAELLLTQALDRDDSLAVEVAYQRANVVALRREYASARDMYQAILTQTPGSPRHNDCRFRVAELTGVLGDAESAVAAFGELAKLPTLAPADRAKVELNRAIFNMDVDSPKKSRKKLIKALTQVEPGLVSYYEAKAWAALSSERLDLADALTLDQRERKQQRLLNKRTGLMRQADEILRQTVALNEPEWVFAGLIRLAASFESLGDDLITAREPKLTDKQLVLYRRGVAEQAEAFWVQGSKYLSGGVDVAERVGWSSSRVEALKAQQAHLMAKIERGAQPHSD